MTDSTEKLTPFQEADVFLRRRYGPAGDDAIRTNTEARAIHDVACAAVAEISGGAGSTAYEMIAAMETANVETTETLIHMVAATVLSTVLDNGVGGPFQQSDGSWAVTFSPADMDAMYAAYDMTATRDGMLTTVRIMPRTVAETDPPVRLYVQDGDADDVPVEPQAEAAVYDRPLWTIHYIDQRQVGHFAMMLDRKDAERRVTDYGDLATVENRYCLHPGCPSEHCNEVTSDAVDKPRA